MPHLTPPTKTTFLISFLLFILGLISPILPQLSAIGASYWLPAAAYIVLALGNLIEGI